MNTDTPEYKKSSQVRRYNFMATMTLDYATKNNITMTTLINRIKQKYSDDQVQWAIIKHDKDIGSEHYHIGLHFSEGRSLRSVAKVLQIKPNFIQYWDNRVYNLWGYLPHITSDAQDEKYNYIDYLDEPDHFISNIPNFKNMVLNDHKIKHRNIKKGELDNLIKGILHGSISERDLLTEDLIEYYQQNYDKVRRALTLRQKSLILNPPACKTLYICGASGLGKSSLAKRIAHDKYDNSYCFSSGANDPLQDYVDEKCFIIDDFRPTDYDFNALLAILDPNIRTRSHKARYINKVLACEQIIITSIMPIDSVIAYYHSINPNEDMKQLRRRIQTIFTLKPNSTYDKPVYSIDAYDELSDSYELISA